MSPPTISIQIFQLKAVAFVNLSRQNTALIKTYKVYNVSGFKQKRATRAEEFPLVSF